MLKFYEKHIGKIWLGAIVPAFLSGLAFSAKFVSNFWLIFLAGMAASLIPIHSFLISKASETKRKEVDYYTTELRLHQWLLGVIKGMLLKKMSRFRNHSTPSPEEYSNAVLANLVALREFYSNFAHDPRNNFRITYFKPSEDGQFLRTENYTNADGVPPFTHGDIEAQRKYFDRDTSRTLAVKAWRNREITVAENESEINYFYDQQKDKYKSILVFPVFENNDASKPVIAIISITSTKEFFKRQGIGWHKNYIEQFALRLVFEYCKLQSIAASRSS